MSTSGRRIAAGLAFAAFLVCGFVLISGWPGPGLDFPVLGVPIGNLLAWVMAVTPALAAWWMLADGPLRRISGYILVLGIGWFPLSWILAGNVLLNFAGDWRLLTWFVLTGICLLLPLVLMIAGGIARIVAGARS